MDIDPQSVTTQTIDVDSDEETNEELDYTISNPSEFVKNAQKKFLGSKTKSKPVDKNCLQETIANAFLDNASAERFLNVFPNKNVLYLQESSLIARVNMIQSSRLLSPIITLI